MRDQLVMERHLHRPEAQVEHAVGDEEQRGEPTGMCLAQRGRHEDVRMRTGSASGDDLDEVEAASGELLGSREQRGVTDGDADTERLRDARKTVDPARVGRAEAHEDRTLRGARGAGPVIDGGGHGSRSSEGSRSVPPRASTGAEVAPSGRETHR